MSRQQEIAFGEAVMLDIRDLIQKRMEEQTGKILDAVITPISCDESVTHVVMDVEDARARAAQ